MINLIKLLRPHQYIKNGFVLIGVLFGHQWTIDSISKALLAFIAFCLIASSVYILNDIMDIEADRSHPSKRNRPLPSGKVSLSTAKIFLVILVMGAFTLSYLVSMWALVFISIYFIMNIFYSWKLKHIVILDVFIISAGFMLRILTGTIGLGIEPTAWLLLCGLMITLLLGFSKRRAELLTVESLDLDENITRKVLEDYSPIVLEQYIGITAACTIMSFGLYTVSPQTINLHGTDKLIYTLPFVIYGIFRYLYLLHNKKKGNDTAKDLITDNHMLITVVLWIIATIWVLV